MSTGICRRPQNDLPNAGAEQKIIGLIESNSEGLPFIFPDSNVSNIGEAFVLPEYRGKQVAQALLHHAAQELLHRNFKTYEYTMVRNIP